MTDIAFHFGASNKWVYACRLVRKAVSGGATLIVVSDAPTRFRLNSNLWNLSATDFVPHCTEDDAPHMQRLSPALFATSTQVKGCQRQVLVNLLDSVPEGFDQFDRLIEVVSADEADRQFARTRWKYYTERGYAIRRHNLASQGENL